MRAPFAILLIHLIGLFVPGKCVYTAVVQTTSGPVRGEILKTGPNSVIYAAFRGIKYAKAPVGHLRFKPPVPVDPWIETVNATVEGNACPQLDDSGTLIGSEDCLFLNVFTPRTTLSVTPRILRSVMVWIHGGAFAVGSGSMQVTRPDYMLERDVVFVSINYRLGALGFLSLDHPNATGNAGLKDQNLALKWVKSNIRRFGGDPSRVTIIGQSAGAASAGYHVLSEASAGLFNGVISMSGAPLAPWAFLPTFGAVTVAERLGTLLGINSTNKETLLASFYNATVTQLVNFSPFLPTVENASIATDPFLTESPYRKYYTGNYTKVPEMLGFMEQETVSTTVSLQQFMGIILATFAQAEIIGIELPQSLTTVRDVIISGGNLSQVDKTDLQAVINISSEFFFVSSIDRTQKFLAADNDDKPVYYYHISFYTNRSLHDFAGPNTIAGAGHSDDIAYIFYIPAANYSQDLNDPVARTIDRVSTMWTNFAKYRNPTPAGTEICPMAGLEFFWTCLRDCFRSRSLINWPDSGPCGYALDIGYELTVGSRPVNENVELIESLSWTDEKRTLDGPGLIPLVRKV